MSVLGLDTKLFRAQDLSDEVAYPFDLLYLSVIRERNRDYWSYWTIYIATHCFYVFFSRTWCGLVTVYDSNLTVSRAALMALAISFRNYID